MMRPKRPVDFYRYIDYATVRTNVDEGLYVLSFGRPGCYYHEKWMYQEFDQRWHCVSIR